MRDPPSRVSLSLRDSFQTTAAARLGAGGLRLLGRIVTRVARGEKVTANGQDCTVFLEVCQQFRTVRMQRDKRAKLIRLRRKKTTDQRELWLEERGYPKPTNKDAGHVMRAKRLTWLS